MEKLSLRALNERESGRIIAISADRALRKHLTEMGFDPGSIATVINKGAAGLMVVEIKGCCRVAISTDMAEKISVEKLGEEREWERKGGRERGDGDAEIPRGRGGRRRGCRRHGRGGGAGKA